jgi:hypothetical protein
MSLPTNELVTKVRSTRIKTILTNVFQTVSSGGGGGSGDVVGPASSTDSEFALFSGTTGKLLKSGGGVKDGTGGVAGLTLFKINFKNALDTVTSFFTNSNTVSRTYTFQDIDGTMAYTFKKYTSGSANNRYHPITPFTASAATAAATINSLRAYPVIVDAPITIDRIACQVTVGTTGNIRIGIYNDDGTGKPGTLVVDSGQLAITTPAVYQATINVTLLPGIYWFAYLTDTANTMLVFSSGNFYPVAGFSSVSFNTTVPAVYLVAQTYGALPNTFTAGGAFSVASQVFLTIRLT